MTRSQKAVDGSKKKMIKDNQVDLLSPDKRSSGVMGTMMLGRMSWLAKTEQNLEVRVVRRERNWPLASSEGNIAN